ncbi:MAG: rane-associated phospholipid phosphatase, partial [Microbacterium sp.]|nr:rane-associated phospholipid phosphatase [Microbacterium sp.]
MDAIPADAPALPVAEADARRAIALVVGALATVAFVALRLAVALNGHTALDVDVWWDAAMAAIATPVGVILAWVPAIVGGTIGMNVLGVATTIVSALRRRPGDALPVAASIALVVAIGAPMA